MKKFFGIVLFVMLFVLSSCGSGGGSMSKSADSSSYYSVAEAAAYTDYDGYNNYSDGENSSATAEQTATSARKLIKDVSISLETKEFDAFIASLENRVTATGGYIESSSVDGSAGYYSSNYSYKRYANITVRIPAAKLDEFTDGISAEANVTSKSESTRDVTSSYYDIESHIKALRTEYDTLLEILEECTKVSDVISVQSRITEVLYQIESYQSTLNHYDDLVSYSTVSLNISEVERETVVTKQTIGGRISAGLSETFADIGEDFGDFSVWFVVNLPYLIIWAVILVALFFFFRFMIRRVRKKNAQKQLAYQQAIQAQREQQNRTVQPPENEQK